LATEEIVADTSSQIIRVNDVEWTAMTPTIKAKMLWSDAATKRRAQLTRFDPGATLPMHRHVGDELLYVIEGSIADEHGTTTTGNVGYRPNGCVHSVSSENGATVLAIVTGGIEPATDLAGAPPSQNFNLSEIAWVEAMPGVRQKPIWHDKETKRRVALARFDPKASVADNAAEFRAAILAVLNDPADAAGRAGRARTIFDRDYSIHANAARLDSAIASAIRVRSARTRNRD